MPWHRDAVAHAHARETHLAIQYTCRHQLLHTQTGDPSCRRRRLLDLHCPRERDPSCYPVHMPPLVVAYPNRRPILPPPSVAWSALPSPASLLHYFILHSSQVFNLSFPSKPNIMFGLGVFVFLLMNWCWWFRDCESKNLFCLWFFFWPFGFVTLWLCDSLWLCVCDSFSCII